MYVNIKLYNLKLDPDNTLYFDTAELQKEFFNSNELLTINDVAYNGARNLRVTGNYQDLITKYNYVSFYNGTMYLYCFIDDILYVNDNVSEVVFSLDVIQTFYDQIKNIGACLVECQTVKNEYFQDYHPLTDLLEVPSYMSISTQALGINKLNETGYTDYALGFLAVNLSTNSGHGYKEYNTYYGNTRVCLLPFLYQVGTNAYLDKAGTIEPLSNISCSPSYPLSSGGNFTTCGLGNITEFMDAYGGLIANSGVGIITNEINGISYSPSTRSIEYNPSNFYAFGSSSCYALGVYSNSTYSNNNINIRSSCINHLGSFRSPYIYIRIGKLTDFIQLNPLDFVPFSVKTDYEVDNLSINTSSRQSLIQPFTHLIEITAGNTQSKIKDPLFRINIPGEMYPYSVSAWTEYYTNNKATVNDGLATQEHYDKVGLGIKAATSLVQGGISGALSGGVGGLAGGLVNGLVGAASDYAQTENEYAKQRALLNIKYNDIKSQPSTFGNVGCNPVLKFLPAADVVRGDVMIARNIDQINNYHNLYGYTIHDKINNYYTSIHKHKYYDYVKITSVDMLSNITLPSRYKQVIINRLQKGIRYWYDYKYIGNYNMENTEV